MYHCRGPKLYQCICVFVYLQLRIYFSDILEYLLWGPVLYRNHCWQILIQYIWVYMPSGGAHTFEVKVGGGHFPRGSSALKLFLLLLFSRLSCSDGWQPVIVDDQWIKYTPLLKNEEQYSWEFPDCKSQHSTDGWAFITKLTDWVWWAWQ